MSHSDDEPFAALSDDGGAKMYEEVCAENNIALPPDVEAVVETEPQITEYELGQYADFARVLLDANDHPGYDQADIFDVLSAALAARCVDTILNRIKNRSAVVELIDRLANSVHLITAVAEALNIVIDDVPVKSSKDFSDYSKKGLAVIGNQIVSKVSSIISTGDTHAELYRLAVQQHQHDEEKIKGMVATAATLMVVTEGRSNEQRDALVHANSILESYHDQAVYVVAHVDKNGAPMKFLRIEPATETSLAKVVGVDDFKLATKWGHFVPANNKRVEIIKERRAKVAKENRQAISKAYVIMRTSLRTVTLADVED